MRAHPDEHTELPSCLLSICEGPSGGPSCIAPLHSVLFVFGRAAAVGGTGAAYCGRQLVGVHAPAPHLSPEHRALFPRSLHKQGCSVPAGTHPLTHRSWLAPRRRRLLFPAACQRHCVLPASPTSTATSSCPPQTGRQDRAGQRALKPPHTQPSPLGRVSHSTPPLRYLIAHVFIEREEGGERCDLQLSAAVTYPSER